MKKSNRISLVSTLVVCAVLIICRLCYSDLTVGNTIKITTWDALGYYMYLPGIFIYHDVTELKWLPAIEKQYSVQGGELYQAQKQKNSDKYFFKYLGGVAILQVPFFFAAHLLAGTLGYPADGFSPPYQYFIAFGILIYFCLSLFLLREILLRYFSDFNTALTILLLVLSSNAIQYASVDTGMSHAPIFSLYVLVIYSTLKWHEQPSALWACVTAYVIGLATISRPTEAIMLFIPVLWNLHSRETSIAKWAAVKQNCLHLVYAVVFGFVGILPQLIYWKYATGTWIYDVGSKWNFLSPWFRVLFGWEKGWFIYTPVAILFIAGMWFMKKFQFQKSVIWFTVLNLWIITAWSGWRYGGSYSTRALVQSYPVFALSLASLIHYVEGKKWRWLFYALAGYLTVVNLFQIYQYNRTILDSVGMNRRYYCHVYLNLHPTAEEMSLLDTEEFIDNENDFSKNELLKSDSLIPLKPKWNELQTIAEGKFLIASEKETWIKTEANISNLKWLWASYLVLKVQQGDSAKENQIRLQTGISKERETNRYAYYTLIPFHSDSITYSVAVKSDYGFEGAAENLKLTLFSK